jgi:hypothetical protein
MIGSLIGSMIESMIGSIIETGFIEMLGFFSLARVFQLLVIFVPRGQWRAGP